MHQKEDVKIKINLSSTDSFTLSRSSAHSFYVDVVNIYID